MDTKRCVFGDCELDPDAFRLLKAGAPVAVEPKALDLLCLLVERAPRVVEKPEIFSRIWKDVAVTDNALTRLIAQLRKALDDDSKSPRYIETVATRGYRFVADVRTVGEVPATPRTEATPPRTLGYAATAAVAIAIVGFAVYALSRPVETPPREDAIRLASVRPMQLTSSSGLDAFPALSPDGLALAFSSDRSGTFQIYVQSLASGSNTTMLTSDGRQNIQPRWSPDGQYIAYHAMGTDGIWIVPARGGVPRQLSEFGSAPAWSPDGKRIAFQSLRVTDLSPVEGTPASTSTIWTVDVDGGAPQARTSSENPRGVHFVPIWSPDGRRILFTVSEHPGSPGGPTEIWSFDVNDHTSSLVSSTPQLTRYLSISAAGDQLFFGTRDSGLPWRLRIDPSTGHANGDPRPLGLAGIGPGARHLAVSGDGRRFVWTAMNQTSNIWSIDIDEATGRAKSDAVPLTDDAGTRATMPIVSVDGRVAYTGSRPGQNSDVFIVTRGVQPRQATVDPEDEFTATWTADGREIVVGREDTGTSLFAFDPESGRTRRLFGPLASLLPPGTRQFGAFAFDARSARFAIGVLKDGVANIWTGVDRGTGPAPLHQLTFEAEAGSYPAISPDGRTIAYQCNERGSVQVCVIPAAGGVREQLTRDSGLHWVNGWAPDNDRVTYAEQQNAVWNIAWVSRTTRRAHTVTSFTRASQFVRYPVWAPGRDRIVFERNEITGRIWMVEIPQQ